MSFKIVIPARYASSRLPGKPLIDIVGKPMIQHVFERAQESLAEEVIIATDDARIEQVARDFGADVCITRADHPSGTDRLAEVASIRAFNDHDIIINVQGDEPCLPAALIDQVADDLSQHHDADIASLYSQITQEKQIFDPNVVKVVMDKGGYAMYFSRAPIPWDREQYKEGQRGITKLPAVYRHIGMYGYRVSFLNQYKDMKATALEQAECLEQLRALSYGIKIHMSVIDIPPGHGVDTPEDIKRVESLLASLN